MLQDAFYWVNVLLKDDGRTRSGVHRLINASGSDAGDPNPYRGSDYGIKEWSVYTPYDTILVSLQVDITRASRAFAT